MSKSVPRQFQHTVNSYLNTNRKNKNRNPRPNANKIFVVEMIFFQFLKSIKNFQIFFSLFQYQSRFTFLLSFVSLRDQAQPLNHLWRFVDTTTFAFGPSLSVCLSVCVSICLFVCIFFGLSFCLSVHL
jgi:hypothetical protein